jgi:hypothetical protein
MNRQLVALGWKPASVLEGRQALNQEVDKLAGQWPELSRMEIKRLVFVHWLVKQEVLSEQ